MLLSFIALTVKEKREGLERGEFTNLKDREDFIHWTNLADEETKT